MRKRVLQPSGTDVAPAVDLPVDHGACAPGSSTSDTLRYAGFGGASSSSAPFSLAAHTVSANHVETLTVQIVHQQVDSPCSGQEARGSEVVSNTVISPKEPPATRHTANQPVPPAQPEGMAMAPSLPIVHSGLNARALTMFLGEGEHPVASGIAAVASEATFGLVLAVRDVVGKLWLERQSEIKAACAL